MAIQEKVALGVWGLFLTSFSGNSAAKFSKEVVRMHSCPFVSDRDSPGFPNKAFAQAYTPTREAAWKKDSLSPGAFRKATTPARLRRDAIIAATGPDLWRAYWRAKVSSAFSSTAPSLEDQSNNDVTFELFDTGTAFTKLNYSGKGVRT